jgi:hypothetical protein
MKFPALILIPVLAASSASAEAPTPWPRYPYSGIESHGTPSVVRAPAATYNVWTDAFVPFGSSAAATSNDKGGQSPTPAAELDAQARAHRIYWERQNAGLIAQDGTLVDVLPVRVHERLNRNAFGSPVMSGDQ